MQVQKGNSTQIYGITINRLR